MPTISTNSNKAGQDIDKEQIDKFNDHYTKCKDVYNKNEEKSEDGLDIKAIQTRNNLPLDDDASSRKKGSKGKEHKLKKQDTYKRQRSDYLIMRKDSKVVLPTKRKKSKK